MMVVTDSVRGVAERFRPALPTRRAVRLFLLLSLLSVGLPPTTGVVRAQDSFGGRWEMEAAPEGDRLSVMLGRRTESGGQDRRYFKLALDELSGLTRAQVFSPGQQVNFQLRRAAGAFDFNGQFKQGRGEGTFTFTADAAYAERLRREGYGEAARENLFGFAIGNFAGTPADDFSALGVERPTPEQLKSMGLFGVTPEFVRELRALGYEPRAVDQLIAMRIHGAGLDFIKGLVARGYAPPPLEHLVGMRIHGASLQFIDELKSLGYEHVPVSQLTGMRIFGVTTDFIRRLRSEGYTDVPVETLIDLKIFKMPVEFLRHLPARAERDASAGEWRVRLYRRGGQKAWAYLRDRVGRVGEGSFEIAPGALAGLTEAQAFSSEGAEVRFTLTRGGQTLLCTGWFKDGFGAGVYTYAPDANKAAR